MCLYVVSTIQLWAALSGLMAPGDKLSLINSESTGPQHARRWTKETRGDGK